MQNIDTLLQIIDEYPWLDLCIIDACVRIELFAEYKGLKITLGSVAYRQIITYA